VFLPEEQPVYFRFDKISVSKNIYFIPFFYVNQEFNLFTVAFQFHIFLITALSNNSNESTANETENSGLSNAPVTIPPTSPLTTKPSILLGTSQEERDCLQYHNYFR